MARDNDFLYYWSSYWAYYTNKLPAPLRNKYLAVTLLFIVWMFFFDRTSILSQIRLRKTLIEVQEQKQFLENEMELDKQTEEMLRNPTLSEKFARERYFMKKNNEEVFIFAPKE